MRVSTYFILLTLFSCSSGSQGKILQKVKTTKPVARTDTTPQEDDEEDVNFRQEFISLYHKPVHIDTFFVDNGKTFEVILNHYSTMDNGLVIPAQYNFDTNKDFTTHNFVSDLTMLADKDTIFKRHITKATFKTLLDT